MGISITVACIAALSRTDMRIIFVGICGATGVRHCGNEFRYINRKKDRDAALIDEGEFRLEADDSIEARISLDRGIDFRKMQGHFRLYVHNGRSIHRSE
jgi:hypothetical protein